MSDPLFTAVAPKPDGASSENTGLAGYVKMFPQAVQDDPEWKPVFEKNPDIASFLKAAKDVLTKPVVRIPDEKATAEDVANFRKAIGIPEKPDDYELLDFADVPLTAEQKKAFKDRCAKRGLTKAQAKVEYEEEIENARVHAKRQAEAKIKLEAEKKTLTFAKWGADSPVKEDRFQKTLPTLPEGFRKALADAGVLDHPEIKDYIQGLYKAPENGAVHSRADSTEGNVGGALFKYKS